MMRALIVDDEPLARSRLRTLAQDCADPVLLVVAEAANAVEALDLVHREPLDLVLLDVQMPGADGMRIAQALRLLPAPPAVVFVTAHAEHAVQAFELDAVDYLTKPVRLERLQAALQKVRRHLLTRAAQADAAEDFLLIQDRGRTERVPVGDVLYLKAELKYVTVRTAQRSFILDGSLAELEDRFSARFLRVHRNALVARHAVRAVERHHDPDEPDAAEGWAVRLAGVDELLSVSRRQLASVREAISG